MRAALAARPPVFLSVLLVGLGSVLHAAAARADVASVRSCVEANTPRLSSILDVSIGVEEEAGEETFASRLKLFWRRLHDGERRILLRFLEPEDLADAGVLVSERPGRDPTVHIYLPGQGRPRNVLSRGELEGFLGQANLGIEELELLLDPLAGEDLRLLTEPEQIAGRDVWVLEEREDEDADTRYVRTLTFVDREFCIPLRAEFYDRQDAQAKTLAVDVDSVTRVVGSWVPRRLVFRDLLRGWDTVLEVLDVEVDAAFSPALLTVEALPGPGR